MFLRDAGNYRQTERRQRQDGYSRYFYVSKNHRGICTTKNTYYASSIHDCDPEGNLHVALFVGLYMDRFSEFGNGL